LYEIDLYSPTEQAAQVTDGVPLFGRWRKANAHAVRVVSATAFPTHPQRSRVKFEVTSPPGAFPFGALGPPAFASEVVGDLPSFADIALFLLNPLGALELAAVKAAATFLGQSVAPELKELRAAISTAKANIATVRAALEAVRNGTAPDNKVALAGAAVLVKETIAMLLKASAAIPVNAPRHVVDNLIGELRAMLKAIEEAPARAIKGAAAAAKGFVTDVVVPFEIGGVGVALGLMTAFYLFEGGKRSKTTDLLLLGAGAVALLGYGSGAHNLLHPSFSKG
jgi:hypothetical protein